MVTITRNLRPEQLIDFLSQRENGCVYKAISNVNYDARRAGILEGPVCEDPEKKFYQITPVHAIKEEIFPIEKGEIGGVADVGVSNNRIDFIKVVWKNTITVHYRNPVEIKNKDRTEVIKLEDMFSIIKIDSKTK